MRGPVWRMMRADHARLDALLRSSLRADQTIDLDAYHNFRGGLLRHIAMEEKILLPAAKRARDGESLPGAEDLRFEHGILAALLVPTPTPAIIAEIQRRLSVHNRREEELGGLYDTCERLAGDNLEVLVVRLRSAPEVSQADFNDSPQALAHVARVLDHG